VRKWALLVAAIAVEFAATLSLRASQDHSGWLVVVVTGHVGSFALLTMVLLAGVPVGWPTASGCLGHCGDGGAGGDDLSVIAPWPPQSTRLSSLMSSSRGASPKSQVGQKNPRPGAAVASG
jgi:hypothetical protein